MDRYLELVKNNPVKFGIESGFEDLTDIHNEWIKSFLFEEVVIKLLAYLLQ